MRAQKTAMLKSSNFRCVEEADSLPFLLVASCSLRHQRISFASGPWQITASVIKSFTSFNLHFFG
jgi:hypothetical protein